MIESPVRNSPSHSSSEADDDEDDDEGEDAWARELEEELHATGALQTMVRAVYECLYGSRDAVKCAGSESRSTGAKRRADADADDASSLLLSQETMALHLAKKPRAEPVRCYASELPQEVLVLVLGFAQVGRVCKAWSLAMSTGAYVGNCVARAGR